MISCVVRRVCFVRESRIYGRNEENVPLTEVKIIVKEICWNFTLFSSDDDSDNTRARERHSERENKKNRKGFPLELSSLLGFYWKEVNEILLRITTAISSRNVWIKHPRGNDRN